MLLSYPQDAVLSISAVQTNRQGCRIVNNLELGKRIKQLRLSQGFTLKDIESKVGVSATHVSEIERGKTSPTVGALAKIASALQVNPSFLVDLPVGGHERGHR